MKTLFVAGFDKHTDKDDLETLFRKYGEIDDVQMFLDRDGEPAGYALVVLDDDGADYAIKRLNGRWWNGRKLKVSPKRERRSNWDDWDEEDEELFRKND